MPTIVPPSTPIHVHLLRLTPDKVDVEISAEVQLSPPQRVTGVIANPQAGILTAEGRAWKKLLTLQALFFTSEGAPRNPPATVAFEDLPDFAQDYLVKALP